jgi:hypothetical protein
MITEIVLFKLPAGMTLEQYTVGARKSAADWAANPDLIRKNYLYDGERGYGGGAYTWRSVADAKKWHNEAFAARIKEIFGSEPTYAYYDTPILVDNEVHQVREAA